MLRQGLRQRGDVVEAALRAEADADGAGGGASVQTHGREDVAGPAPVAGGSGGDD